MGISRRLLTALSLTALWLPAALAAAPSVAPAPGGTLRLATWNLEWLIAPDDFPALAASCVPAGGNHHGQRAIPCDTAATLERGAADFAALARVAAGLEADVVALQEVDGERAARQVFPGWSFCFSGGPAVQKTGFAVRAGLPHRCAPDYGALSLGDQLRRGAVLIVYPGTPRELHLMSVHLKSGCARGPLARGLAACRRLAGQGPLLAAWLHGQEAAGHDYALLGDFNRDLQAEIAAGVPGLWAQLNDAATGAPLADSAAQLPYRNCRRGQRSSGYIDHLLLSPRLQARLVPGSLARITFDPAEAWHHVLSDHCPVALSLRVD